MNDGTLEKSGLTREQSNKKPPKKKKNFFKELKSFYKKASGTTQNLTKTKTPQNKHIPIALQIPDQNDSEQNTTLWPKLKLKPSISSKNNSVSNETPAVDDSISMPYNVKHETDYISDSVAASRWEDPDLKDKMVPSPELLKMRDELINMSKQNQHKLLDIPKNKNSFNSEKTIDITSAKNNTLVQEHHLLDSSVFSTSPKTRTSSISNYSQTGLSIKSNPSLVLEHNETLDSQLNTVNQDILKSKDHRSSSENTKIARESKIIPENPETETRKQSTAKSMEINDFFEKHFPNTSSNDLKVDTLLDQNDKNTTSGGSLSLGFGLGFNENTLKNMRRSSENTEPNLLKMNKTRWKSVSTLGYNKPTSRTPGRKRTKNQSILETDEFIETVERSIKDIPSDKNIVDDSNTLVNAIEAQNKLKSTILNDKKSIDIPTEDSQYILPEIDLGDIITESHLADLESQPNNTEHSEKHQHVNADILPQAENEEPTVSKRELSPNTEQTESLTVPINQESKSHERKNSSISQYTLDNKENEELWENAQLIAGSNEPLFNTVKSMITEELSNSPFSNFANESKPFSSSLSKKSIMVESNEQNQHIPSEFDINTMESLLLESVENNKTYQKMFDDLQGARVNIDKWIAKNLLEHHCHIELVSGNFESLTQEDYKDPQVLFPKITNIFEQKAKRRTLQLHIQTQLQSASQGIIDMNTLANSIKEERKSSVSSEKTLNRNIPSKPKKITEKPIETNFNQNNRSVPTTFVSKHTDIEMSRKSSTASGNNLFPISTGPVGIENNINRKGSQSSLKSIKAVAKLRKLSRMNPNYTRKSSITKPQIIESLEISHPEPSSFRKLDYNDMLPSIQTSEKLSPDKRLISRKNSKHKRNATSYFSNIFDEYDFDKNMELVFPPLPCMIENDRDLTKILKKFIKKKITIGEFVNYINLGSVDEGSKKKKHNSNRNSFTNFAVPVPPIKSLSSNQIAKLQKMGMLHDTDQLKPTPNKSYFGINSLSINKSGKNKNNKELPKAYDIIVKNANRNAKKKNTWSESSSSDEYSSLSTDSDDDYDSMPVPQKEKLKIKRNSVSSTESSSSESSINEPEVPATGKNTHETKFLKVQNDTTSVEQKRNTNASLKNFDNRISKSISIRSLKPRINSNIKNMESPQYLSSGNSKNPQTQSIRIGHRETNPKSDKLDKSSNGNSSCSSLCNNSMVDLIANKKSHSSNESKSQVTEFHEKHKMNRSLSELNNTNKPLPKLPKNNSDISLVKSSNTIVMMKSRFLNSVKKLDQQKNNFLPSFILTDPLVSGGNMFSSSEKVQGSLEYSPSSSIKIIKSSVKTINITRPKKSPKKRAEGKDLPTVPNSPKSTRSKIVYLDDTNDIDTKMISVNKSTQSKDLQVKNLFDFDSELMIQTNNRVTMNYTPKTIFKSRKQKNYSLPPLPLTPKLDYSIFVKAKSSP
ncbi:hypothetical protein BB559_001176 [Furculomyces boomerangus]|uniref:Uncharacterized protein n=1 Tax=Furculomyces boomerangus TaxID=61424 RepID=A0A2T9Z2S6_9FUNG|nr:hypothetical protein BB559_001176 [Furculomyces boomerangus]